MKQVHLHIGRAKTGTTAIQSHLKAARQSLAADGIIYPKTGTQPNKPSHLTIALACHQNSNQPDAQLISLRNDFETEVRDYGQIIVSSEGFQNVTNLRRLNLFFRKEDGASPYSLNVACCLREYLDAARSAYAERVQATSLLCTFEQFCAHFSQFDLGCFLGMWQRFADQMTIINYHRGSPVDNGIVPTFFDAIEIGHHYRRMEGNPNPTISGNLLAFKLLLNQTVPHQPGYYNGLRALALESPRYRGPFYIGRSQAARLRSSDNSYNTILKSRCGEVPEREFTDGHPFLDPERWKDDIERFLAEPAFWDIRDVKELREIPISVTTGLSRDSTEPTIHQVVTPISWHRRTRPIANWLSRALGRSAARVLPNTGVESHSQLDRE